MGSIKGTVPIDNPSGFDDDVEQLKPQRYRGQMLYLICGEVISKSHRHYYKCFLFLTFVSQNYTTV